MRSHLVDRYLVCICLSLEGAFGTQIHDPCKTVRCTCNGLRQCSALSLVHQVGTFSSSVSVKVPSRSKTMASGGWPPSGNGASCGGVSVAVAGLDIPGTRLCCLIGPADIPELRHHLTSAESVNCSPFESCSVTLLQVVRRRKGQSSLPAGTLSAPTGACSGGRPSQPSEQAVAT